MFGLNCTTEILSAVDMSKSCENLPCCSSIAFEYIECTPDKHGLDLC